MKNTVIITQSESEQDFLNSISRSVRDHINHNDRKVSNLESKVSDLERKNEVLKNENEELKQKLEKKNQLFSFWPKIRKI